MKLGVIGLGDIARKAYLPLLSQWPGVDLVLCTRDGDCLQQLARRYRVAEYCRDYRELPALAVDAVMIHAATAAHTEIAAFFLRQGIPTFVDKPLAASAADCERLYELAHRVRQPLYVGFNRRHIPLFERHLPGLQRGERADLRALRWEKHRFDQAGALRNFIFDDFIHPLDSVNLYGRASLEDAFVTCQRDGGQLARVDVQWQHGEMLLHASMNRQFGRTAERVSAQFTNAAYEFDSFTEGRSWCGGNEARLVLPDWTPMLASKGFSAMLDDWFGVIASGQLDARTVARNLASHQLAESLCENIATAMTKTVATATVC
ncbi:Gfo/Idh/MocA family oxidoreductase [Microbulbifer sp. SAOS-129_SWC]|uniref:Gfo/Idh/MocA family protein n=1 Tax=Microbulbifer sp. SAOS-129_SWC TaxID=3145235 RepID=UPI003216DCC6